MLDCVLGFDALTFQIPVATRTAYAGHWIRPNVLATFRGAFLTESTDGGQQKRRPASGSFSRSRVSRYLCSAAPKAYGSGDQSTHFCSAAPKILATSKEITEDVSWEACDEARIAGQCLPMLVGFGPIYPAPLYFAPNRIPVAMSPKTDARLEQPVRAGDFNRQHPLAKVHQTGQSFFLWDYGRAAG